MAGMPNNCRLGQEERRNNVFCFWKKKFGRVVSGSGSLRLPTMPFCILLALLAENDYLFLHKIHELALGASMRIYFFDFWSWEQLPEEIIDKL